MRYYASIYALSMAVMLILKAVRGVVFVKVCSGRQASAWPLGFILRRAAPLQHAGPCWNDRNPLSLSLFVLAVSPPPSSMAICPSPVLGIDVLWSCDLQGKN